MGLIALAGGNEFRDNCKAMDRYILEQIKRQPPRVVILPTAAVKGSPRMAAENGVRYFKALGADASAVMVITHEDANNLELFAAVRDADLVYIAGGDPWYLLETLRDSALLLEVLAVQGRGGVIAGSSAGAMVLAEKMRTENSVSLIESLGVVKNVAVLPHHQNAAQEAVKRLQEQLEPSVSILGIDEATACIRNNSEPNDWLVIGIGGVTVYVGTSMMRYPSGQRFSLP
jgi:cyanophycinase